MPGCAARSSTAYDGPRPAGAPDEPVSRRLVRRATAGRVGDEARVAGWVHRRRDHGGLVFVDLRDRTGLVQVVFNPETAPDAHAASHALRSEWVISVRGEIVRRSEETINPDLPTGEIEIRVAEVDVLAEALTPPFQLDEDVAVDEALRLRYRYLDLRREALVRSLELRHRVIAAMRSHLDPQGFLEIETPILTRSTPEGARDFIVPSRFQRGSFYALPQSPQLFKQLLMVGGYERYYQIARCFRDEDLRADRQPEFTQLDLEMSFVNEDDVIAVSEGILAAAFSAAGIDCRCRCPGSRSRRRWPGTGATGRTCGSGWRSTTSARRSRARSSRSSAVS